LPDLVGRNDSIRVPNPKAIAVVGSEAGSNESGSQDKRDNRVLSHVEVVIPRGLGKDGQDNQRADNKPGDKLK
jgi:hypothetical protein